MACSCLSPLQEPPLAQPTHTRANLPSPPPTRLHNPPTSARTSPPLPPAYWRRLCSGSVKTPRPSPQCAPGDVVLAADGSADLDAWASMVRKGGRGWEGVPQMYCLHLRVPRMGKDRAAGQGVRFVVRREEAAVGRRRKEGLTTHGAREGVPGHVPTHSPSTGFAIMPRLRLSLLADRHHTIPPPPHHHHHTPCALPPASIPTWPTWMRSMGLSSSAWQEQGKQGRGLSACVSGCYTAGAVCTYVRKARKAKGGARVCLGEGRRGTQGFGGHRTVARRIHLMQRGSEQIGGRTRGGGTRRAAAAGARPPTPAHDAPCMHHAGTPAQVQHACLLAPRGVSIQRVLVSQCMPHRPTRRHHTASVRAHELTKLLAELGLR